MRLSIDMLQPTEFYLVNDVVEYLQNQIDGGKTLPSIIVAGLWNNKYVIRDGNTQVYLLYKNGVIGVETVQNNDDQEFFFDMASTAGQHGVHHVKDLEDRIVDETTYESLMVQACAVS